MTTQASRVYLMGQNSRILFL